ncbi:cleavage and polyadenylation specificity factor subunit 5 [Calocera cornea HHB12733]|uniref:Cleavage and polyadenylation specificity factor subunit 5 n=1 Tax=Calocera cornea HHB12733 TaxID=1353952 RepID=A0A165IG48_9BASI|nr:cleavage and polyadenylation specificity factor subunit 5 [Calocera cornea HHB12733]
MTARRLTLYPQSNYQFTTKDKQPEEDPTVSARMRRLESEYEVHGMRRSVDAILLFHQKGFPHLLILQISNTYFKLPGGYLNPGEDEIEGLKQRLQDRLHSPTHDTLKPGLEDWVIRECVGKWWRPDYDQKTFPWIPDYVTHPKECKKVFVVQLPSHKIFAIPTNMKMIGVPLFELYGNATRYGPQIAMVPQMLSAYDFVPKGDSKI